MVPVLLVSVAAQLETRVFSLADTRAGHEPADELWRPFSPRERNETVRRLCGWAGHGDTIVEYATAALSVPLASPEIALLSVMYEDGVPAGFSILSDTPTLGGSTTLVENRATLDAMRLTEGTAECVVMCRASNATVVRSPLLDKLNRRIARTLLGAHSIIGVAATQAGLDALIQPAAAHFKPFEHPTLAVAKLLVSKAPDVYVYPAISSLPALVDDEPPTITPPCAACSADGTLKHGTAEVAAGERRPLFSTVAPDCEIPDGLTIRKQGSKKALEIRKQGRILAEKNLVEKLASAGGARPGKRRAATMRSTSTPILGGLLSQECALLHQLAGPDMMTDEARQAAVASFNEEGNKKVFLEASAAGALLGRLQD